MKLPRLSRRRARRVGGWGRLARVDASIERPAYPADVAALLRADRPPARGVIARGLGRSYGDAAQVEHGRVLDTSGLRAIGPVDTAAGTIDVGAGVSLGDLMRRLVPQGWMVPVLPGTRHVTVGGAIAADIHGKNHHVAGSFGGHVESFALAIADGTERVVTREADRALFEATVGGLGLTGVITSARLRLVPAPSGFVRVQNERKRSLAEVIDRLAEVDREAPYSVAWLDLASSRRRGRGVVQSAEIAQRDWLSMKRREATPEYRPRTRLVAPPLPGSGLVRPGVIRAFNEVYWRCPRRAERLQPLAAFFHPLDAVAGWNRLYGQGGFVQYQVVIPHGAETLLEAIVQRFAEGPVTPALAVLKRMGQPGEGLLSFPLPGWTLAVDLPATDARVFLLLDEMDEAVAMAGGRVYLAKDARMRPEALAQMYRRLEEWRAIKRAVDPGNRFRSDLAVRLGLVEAPGAG